VSQAHPSPDEVVSISLPTKYWTLVVLGIDLLNQTSMAQLKQLQEQGIDPQTLPETLVTALVGPLMTRASSSRNWLSMAS